MTGSEGRRPAWAGVRLLAILLLLAAFLTGPLLPAGIVNAAVCAGDEQLLLAPSEPHAGEPLIVAAVSRFPHERVLLSGTSGPLETTSMVVGDRFVWQATLVAEAPGPLVFTFGPTADGLAALACAQVSAVILDQQTAAGEGATAPPSASTESSALFASLHPWQSGGVIATSSGSPAADLANDADMLDPALSDSQSGASEPALPTRTPRPTRTPSRHTASDNGNENDNEADPTPTKTHTPTRTPTLTRTPAPVDTPRPTSTARPSDTPRPAPTNTRAPTDTPSPTATLAPPEIDVPEVVTCGQPMTVRGERLGKSQSAVSGRVSVDGRDASVISWSMQEIEVRVPITARQGNDRVVTVVVAGQTASGSVRISCT